MKRIHSGLIRIGGKIKFGKAETQTEAQADRRLNGAQTTSLINTISQIKEGTLTEGQAIAIIATALQIEPEEAKRIIHGSL